MEKGNEKYRCANVTTMVIKGQADIRYKVKNFPNVYGQYAYFPSNTEVKIFEQGLANGSFFHEGIEHIYTKKRFVSALIPSFRQLNAIKKYRPNCVLLHGLYFPHIVGLLRLFLGEKTKIVVQDHANQLPSKWKQWAIKRSDRWVDRYVFTSIELAKPWLDAKIISSHNKIIECPEGSTSFKRDVTIEKEPNAFLWVARLDQNKDPLTILSAFKCYLIKNPTARLNMFFANKTLLPEVETFVTENNLGMNVILHGESSQMELEKWYQSSGYFLLGSSKEGGSFALMEAMACGCVPIVTDIPANRKMLNDGKMGYLFPPKDVTALVEVLNALNPEKLNEKSNEVVRFFEQEQSFQAIARKLSEGIVIE